MSGYAVTYLPLACYLVWLLLHRDRSPASHVSEICFHLSADALGQNPALTLDFPSGNQRHGTDAQDVRFVAAPGELTSTILQVVYKFYRSQSPIVTCR